jgi:hypothetical protein
MTMSEEIVMPVTDADYEAWIRAHPHGYVINIPKSEGGVMYWRRADCDHIRPDGTLRFVEGQRIKACSLDPGALASWVKQQPQPLNYCITCRDKWRSEQRHTSRTSE